MMKQSWLCLGTIVICLLSAVALLYWGGQDKLGHFHAEYLWGIENIGIALFFIGPHLLLGTTMLLVPRHKAAAIGLAGTAVLCGFRILIGWIEHEQFLREPPGRETQPMLGFLTTILLWLWSVTALVAVGTDRLLSRRRDLFEASRSGAGLTGERDR